MKLKVSVMSLFLVVPVVSQAAVSFILSECKIKSEAVTTGTYNRVFIKNGNQACTTSIHSGETNKEAIESVLKRTAQLENPFLVKRSRNFFEVFYGKTDKRESQVSTYGIGVSA